jgi:hypothetical protein
MAARRRQVDRGIQGMLLVTFPNYGKNRGGSGKP